MMFVACGLLIAIPVAVIALVLQEGGSPEQEVDAVNTKDASMPIPVLYSTTKPKKRTRSGFDGIYEEDDMYANSYSSAMDNLFSSDSTDPHDL